MGPRVSVHRLGEPPARAPEVAGAKAANLARAASAGFPVLPGFVITTDGVVSLDTAAVSGAVEAAYDELSDGSVHPVVVRSSSTIEDATASSMAGRFTSVLDVTDRAGFDEAVRAVVASAGAVGDGSGTPRPMAVLVQRQAEARLGGVLFGVDPVTGRRDDIVVEAVPTRPDTLVGGTAIADHYVLSRRGRVRRVTRTGSTPPLDPTLRHSLARLARRASRTFGAPQDIEWCVDDDGRLWLLQSRPVTAVAAADAPRHTPLLGPGPVAETFPAPLRRLEADLWIGPLREGIGRALRTTGAASSRQIGRSPVVTTVGGWAAVDLELIGLTDGRTSLRRRVSPAGIARRLLTAWRVGRLRVALPAMLDAIVATVDRDLEAIPRLDEVATEDLADLLDRAGRELATVHAHEVLAGMLLASSPEGPSAPALALEALRDGRTAGWSDEEIIRRVPVVLALVPPCLGCGSSLPPAVPPRRTGATSLAHLGRRDALRLRARWLQELEVRLVWAIGERLAVAGSLTDVTLLGELALDDLGSMVDGGPPPADLGERRGAGVGPPLPTAFRLAVGGEVRPAGRGASRQPGEEPPGLPAGGGRGVGTVRHQPPDAETPAEARPVLVTRHLEPQLAAALPALAGLVSETGSALSHLAILAREMGVPTVVGVPDATRRFPPGTRVLVDGSTGDVDVLEPAVAEAENTAPVGDERADATPPALVRDVEAVER